MIRWQMMWLRIGKKTKKPQFKQVFPIDASKFAAKEWTVMYAK